MGTNKKDIPNPFTLSLHMKLNEQRIIRHFPPRSFYLDIDLLKLQNSNYIYHKDLQRSVRLPEMWETNLTRRQYQTHVTFEFFRLLKNIRDATEVMFTVILKAPQIEYQTIHWQSETEL